MAFGVFMLALLILAYAQPEGSFLWFESYRSRYQWLGLDEITYYEIHNIAMIPLVVVAVLFGPQAGVAFGVISSLLAFMNSAYWWDGRIYAVILFNVLYGFLARAQESGISDSWGYYVARGIILCLAMVWGPLAGAIFGALSSPLHTVLIYSVYSPAKIFCGFLAGLLGGWMGRYMGLRRFTGKVRLLCAGVASLIAAVISTLLDSYLSVAMSSMVEVTSRYGLGEYLGTVVENLGQDMEITMQILLNNGLLSVLITTLTAVVLFFLVEDCFPHIFREKKVTDASVQGTPAQN